MRLRNLFRHAPSVLCCLVLLALPACVEPSPDAYVVSSGGPALGQPIGRNASGEECVASPGSVPPADLPAIRSQEVFCRGWTQPAARVTFLRGANDPAQIDAIAAGGVWRAALERRFACGAPQPFPLPSGGAARRLDCTRKVGGWPHVAIVAAGQDGPVVADGLPTTIGLLAQQAAGGREAVPGPAVQGARSAALAAQVSRLSAGAFSATDLGKYEEAMTLGRQLNQAENYAAAEEAYRAALVIQERLLGRDNPNVVNALMHLAVNLSNQGRRAEARRLFARAGDLAPRAADPIAQARLLHYRGLDALGGGDPATAATLLAQAEAAYAVLVPPSDAAASRADIAGNVVVDPVAQAALVGEAEARRNRAVALARSGRAAEGAAVAASAQKLLRDADLDPDLLAGRGFRTAAGSSGALGQDVERVRLLTASARRFRQGAPGERPEAVTLFLAGGRSVAAGRTAEALESFRAGAGILRSRQLSLSPAMVMPYLDALAAEAGRSPATAAATYAEMFNVAQLAQRPRTEQLVAQASARLGASGDDSSASRSVRQLQDAERELRGLSEERDLAEGAASRELDARIAAALAKRAEVEEAVAAAAPGYRQFVGAAVGADAVARVLAPTDALVSMVIGPDHGYAFAVRPDGTVRAARIALSDAQVAALVARIRKGVEQRNATPDMAASYAAYQAVLEPLAPALEGVETLLVVPDGALLTVPLGLLLTGPGDASQLRTAPWLVRRYAVEHVPSPQVVVTLRTAARSRPGGMTYAGYGDPVPPTRAQLARSFPPDRCSTDLAAAANLVALPNTPRELDAARRLTSSSPASIHLGPAFTAAALRSADLSGASILHLATHALLPGELSCLREPTLVASPPRGAPDASTAFVPASELMKLKLDADLVILSACNTGGNAGRAESGGEALGGLARAFFFAGARGLLATHWEISDASTAYIVASVIEEQKSRSTAAALRTVQLRLLDQAGAGLPAELAHPYHWASFALIGDGRRVQAGPAAALQVSPRT